MLPQSASVSPQPRRFGVGIDTSRYGHYACFLRDDVQPAAAELAFAESAAGYRQLRERLAHIRQRHGPVHFVIRLDAAGQYADNLLHFVHALDGSLAEVACAAAADAHAAAHAARLTVSVSCGDPQRNKNYRAALFGNKKSDPDEARAAARYAVNERPVPATPIPVELRVLRQIAGRLHAVVRQRTRLINQFHHLLALTFPELALLQKDIAVGWVLELVHRYPTATLLAKASAADLDNVPYLPHAQIDALLEHARTSIASLSDEAIAELVREQVRQLRDSGARQKRLEKLLVAVYERLPQRNHLDTIPGIGQVTAAVLTAFIADIDRFDTPSKLVAYFGALPIQASSGVDRDGNPRGPKRYVMSRRGNDLVRRYLWMAGLSAVRFNPAVRPLYARVVAKHPDKKAIAIGHAMRKLLHLVFALWKTGKPFDPERYPWATPAHVEGREQRDEGRATEENGKISDPAMSSDPPMSRKEPAAGLTPDEPAKSEVTAEVTAASSITSTLHGPAHAVAGRYVDFAHLKKQLPIARLLDQLGLRLRGAGPQRRGPCPIHRGDGRGRTFSVHLDDNVFQCFDARCAAKGDAIDLWARLRGLSLRDAALDLVDTFGLEPAP
jgi:transposase